MERLSQTVFILFALLFAVAGIYLVLPFELAALDFLARDNEPFLPVAAAAGFLLAASLSLQCALKPGFRSLQHPLLLAFGTLISLGLSRVDAGAAMVSWVLLAVYAIPLLRFVPRRPRVGPLQPGESEGTIKWFNPNKGFGFILTTDGREIFVHFKALANGGRRSLRQGQTVRFSIRHSERGEQAENVLILR